MPLDAKDRRCPRCGGDRTEVQVDGARLAAETMPGMFGVSKEPLYALVCRKCGAVELFVKNPSAF
jgi:predicted nucleic-acid-binding Zn-ribbon protein